MTNTILGQIAGGAVGALAGVAVMGIADQFTRTRALWPAPICRGCGSRPLAIGYLPVVGPVITHGHCPHCDVNGSWRLPALVQVVTAVLGLLLFQRYGWSWLLLCTGVEATVLMAVAVVDLQHRLIPTLLVYPTIVFAAAFSPLWPNLGLWSSLAGGGLAFGLFFSLAFIARVTFGEGALGDGDVTLAALIGVICGYPLVVLSLALGALSGGIGALVMLALRRSKLGATIPYGPYLVAGILYVLVSGNTLHPLYGAV